MFAATPPDPTPGQLLARGVCRMVLDLGGAPVTEYAPAAGLRADVAALMADGEVWIVECKSSVADYRADRKWRGYLDWCDRFFFATPAGLPGDLTPAEEGLILADGFGAEILRPAAPRRLAAARRQAQTRRLARVAALRLRAHADPGAAAFVSDGEDEAG